MSMNSRIRKRPVFEKLLFSQCWEDPLLDVEALHPGPGKRLMVVTSGGCTALSLLAAAPCEMVAVDMNAAQSHLLELKVAGLGALSHEQFLSLLGVRFLCDRDPECEPAETLYARIRDGLTAPARAFWDAHESDIRRGVVQAGRYERYLGWFRRLLRLVMGVRKVETLVRLPLDRQEHFYREQWDRPAWRLLFRVFFSRALLGRRGLDPEFFNFVDDVNSFGEHFRLRAQHALVDLPVRENYFVCQIATGRYLDRRSVPPYLLGENSDALRERVRRLRIVTGELERFLLETPENSFDGFALSNVFEWTDEETFTRLLREIHRVARPGARLCYRNLLVHRHRPAALAGAFRPVPSESADLLRRDRSFVYRRVVVEQAVGPPVPAVCVTPG